MVVVGDAEKVANISNVWIFLCLYNFFSIFLQIQNKKLIKKIIIFYKHRRLFFFKQQYFILVLIAVNCFRIGLMPIAPIMWHNGQTPTNFPTPDGSLGLTVVAQGGRNKNI